MLKQLPLQNKNWQMPTSQVMDKDSEKKKRKLLLQQDPLCIEYNGRDKVPKCLLSVTRTFKKRLWLILNKTKKKI